MDLGSPATWRWIWLVTMVVFAIGEMGSAGSFYLAPFAVGAGVAAILAFANVDVGVTWAAFMGVSIISFLALRPLAKRLNKTDHALGVGSVRQVGRRASVIEAIGGEHEPGMVLVGRESWRAQSADGLPIPNGAIVVVTEVRGTRVIVEATLPSD